LHLTNGHLLRRNIALNYLLGRKIIYVYLDKITNNSTRTLTHNRYASEKYNHTLIVLEHKNIGTFLNVPADFNIKPFDIRKRIIADKILTEYGGIFLDSDTAIIGDLNELQSISNYQCLDTGVYINFTEKPHNYSKISTSFDIKNYFKKGL